MTLVEPKDIEKAQEHSVFALCKNEKFMREWITPFQLCSGCGMCKERGEKDVQ